jgi:aminoglycoside phosphotransferase (APT) family kinase protein
VPWLAGHQLAQRIAVSSLDWSVVAAPDTDGLRELWDRREELLAALDPVPVVVCHGDFHVGNLIAGDGVTTVLDWGTLGVGPVGADLAHLALSTLEDPLDAYLAGLGSRFEPGLVRLGYQVTLALTAASRVHWMLTQGMPVPPGYVDFAITGSGRPCC